MEIERLPLVGILNDFMSENGNMEPCTICGSATFSTCTRPYCPQRIRRNALNQMIPLSRLTQFSGPAPAPFVGHYGYPRVNVGILSTPIPPRNSDELDSPHTWAEQLLGIPEIVNIRSALINARFSSDVRNHSRLVSIAQEVSMATHPAEVEVSLKKNPGLTLSTSHYESPSGPIAPASTISLIGNPSMSTKIEKVVSDTDLKTADAMQYLYSKGFDETKISRLMSVGLLGASVQRRLVPTRWAITASDDIIGKHLAQEIMDFPESEATAYTGNYLGNHYIILFFPGPWSFELFETMVSPNATKAPQDIESWTDYEGPFGRKQYASHTAGGYYACRLAVLESLNALKRKASVLALRFVTEDYSLPLGVWVVREASRKAMEHTPIRFGDEKLMVDYASARVRKSFGLDTSHILKKSNILTQRAHQPRLNRFF